MLHIFVLNAIRSALKENETTSFYFKPLAMRM